MMSALSTTAAAPEASARDEAYLRAAVTAEHEASAKRASLEEQVTAADLVRARFPAFALSHCPFGSASEDASQAAALARSGRLLARRAAAVKGSSAPQWAGVGVRLREAIRV